MKSVFVAIDLKSFYASVECIERGLDPLNTNLVVADRARTEKTICLAVSPSLKKHGIPGRARLFEVVTRVREVNSERRRNSPSGKLSGSSVFSDDLERDPTLELDYIAAPPRMALYMKYSARIYNVYLRHVAPEDIHVYSIDEVFMDIGAYLRHSGLSAREFVKMLIKEILDETGITATAGIGTNLYLCKVAMDIVAKKIKPDSDGVRIAELDELSYREKLWDHTPLTDFWRVGKGYAATLEKNGIYTMGDVARCSVGDDHSYYNEDRLYKLFGVNAELLIDHAWGRESCTMRDIKSYRPSENSIGSGQVLHCPYEFDKAKLIVREMCDALSLDLVERGLVTDKLTLTVGYDIDNLSGEHGANYKGVVTVDYYGRRVPKHAHGTANLRRYSASTKMITRAVLELFDSIVDKGLLVRRLNLVACRILPEDEAKNIKRAEQISIFDDLSPESNDGDETELLRERKMQSAIIGIKKKFGKNAIIKGMDLEDGATAVDRNAQIGGHKA